MECTLVKSRVDTRMSFKCRPTVVALVAIAALVSNSTLLAAEPIIDQSFDAVAAGSTGGLNIQFDQQLAQTFTLGTGGQLATVSFQVRTSNSSPPNGSLLFDLRPTIGGIPVENDALSFFSATIPVTSIPIFAPITDQLVHIDLRPFSIFTVPNEILAIALSYDDFGSYVWLSQSAGLGGTYPRGEGFARGFFNPGWGRLSGETDFGFQVIVVPEPASLALLCLGFAGLGLASKHKTSISL